MRWRQCLPEQRARLLSLYRIIDLCAVIGAQYLIPAFGAGGFAIFSIMAMLFCLPAGWMLLAGLASGSLVYCLGGIDILSYYDGRVHLDSAGMARVEYFMQNARHYLLDKGLLVELLQADKPEWLLEQDRSLELARLKAKERPSFTDTIQRLEFLVEHYALICDERGWQWRERVQKSAGRLKAGEERKREPRLLPWERQALVGVLIDIFEERPAGPSARNSAGLP